MYHRWNSRCLKNSHNLASESRLLTTVSSFNNDMGLSLDDKTKDYIDRNTEGLVYSLHEVTQLGQYSR